MALSTPCNGLLEAVLDTGALEMSDVRIRFDTSASRDLVLPSHGAMRASVEENSFRPSDFWSDILQFVLFPHVPLASR